MEQCSEVVSADMRNGENDVKSSACWIWRPTGNVIDHTSKDSGSYMLKRLTMLIYKIIKRLMVDLLHLEEVLEAPHTRSTPSPSHSQSLALCNISRDNTVNTAKAKALKAAASLVLPWPVKRAFNQKSAAKTNKFNEKVNTVRVNNVTTAGLKAVVSAAVGNGENIIKSLACWIWRPTGNVIDYTSKDSRSYMLKRFDYVDLQGRLKSIIKRLMVDFSAFGGSPKGGKITRKGKIRTGKLDFEDVYFVKELKFNLFSVSQMCDKKNSVLFTKTECLVLSPDFKLLDESQEFDLMKGIKREFSVARTLQQNRVAERKNRTLIKAARTMLADSLLPTTFWVEAVSTACYVQNRVLVTKPHNKIPYELLHGSGLDWLFDIDLLTNSMNYEPDTAGNQTNKNVGERNGQKNDGGASNKEDDQNVQDFRAALDNLLVQQEGYANSTNKDSTVSPSVSTVGQSFTNADDLPTDPLMPDLEDTVNLLNTGIFSGAYDDEDVGANADLNNLETTINRLVDLPKGKHAIETKWVYRNKKDVKGIVVRNKERLVGQENGFRKGTIDKTLFIKKDRGDILLVHVYVDDIIFGSTKKSLCVEFEQIMHKRFQMSSIGELTFFLGLQVKQKDDGIFISQDKYVADILKKFDFVTMKTESPPIKTNKALLKDEEANDVDVHLYRSMIGSLMYLTASRPDIMFAVCACARDSPFDLEAFFNSDYVGASLDKKSTIGAEYVAATNCCRQVLWIQNHMLDYGFNFMNTNIYIDNESTICIVKNLVFHSKTKHIEIRHHFIRDSYEKRLIQVIKIHTDHNVVDLLTKAFDVSSVRDKFGNKTSSCKAKHIDYMKCVKNQTPRQAKRGRDTKIPQSGGPREKVGNEAVYKELGDKMKRAATTASLRSRARQW
ncbi:retrovirus-related pol polyprotein from transposon TNT 1-94 [Tanacetum coccineum]